VFHAPFSYGKKSDNGRRENKMPKPDEIKNDEVNNDTGANESDANANQNGDANTQTQQDVPQYVTVDDFMQMQTAVTSLTNQIGEILGGIKAIKDAQGVMVRAGATIVDDSDPEPEDDFKPLSELDFTIHK